MIGASSSSNNNNNLQLVTDGGYIGGLIGELHANIAFYNLALCSLRAPILLADPIKPFKFAVAVVVWIQEHILDRKSMNYKIHERGPSDLTVC